MERKLFMQFEFQDNHGEIYWLPLFIAERSPANLAATEVAISAYLSEHFSKVKRYALTSDHLVPENIEILNEYVSGKREGDPRMLIPSQSRRFRIIEFGYDKSMKFTSELSLHDYAGEISRSIPLFRLLEEQCVPVQIINSIEDFEMKEHMVFRMKSEEPAYLPPHRLEVFNSRIGFLIGLIITMTLVLTAFSWKTLTKHSSDPFEYDYGDVEEEWASITVWTKEPPPPPPKRAPNPVIAPVKPTVEFKKAESSETVINEPTISFGEEEFPLAKEIISSETEPPVFFADEMPSYPGCENLLSKEERKKCTDRKIQELLGKMIVYPEPAVDIGLEGTVYVSFVVEKDGSIQHVSVLQGATGGKILDKEAVRVVSALPDFTPGRQGGEKVRVQYNMPVTFKLK